MKKLILILLAPTIFALSWSSPLLFNACYGPINVPPILENSLIDSGISSGIAIGLRLGVKDDAKRTVIANYIDVGAHSLDTVSGSPTPEQLAALIESWIPPDVIAQYPELLPFIEPVVISAYQAFLNKYGNDTAQVRAFLSRVARDLETGVAPFITHHSSPTP